MGYWLLVVRYFLFRNPHSLIHNLIMSFEWLNQFHSNMEKPANYAEKTLAAYKLGMKAKGSIVGVRIVVHPDCCPACRALLDPDHIYHPDEAPHLPPAECERGRGCLCVYRPVMKYEVEEEGDAPA